ncbi:hypothetical protein NGRA_1380 [Nosema granulosis]|uniref:Bifunctional polynucleotide phosphatase/kinase n=1 Tax=Nosema granulosis TaxID=83296 RepID=A0A9P6H065_9MICR|nr:hypothetical protein NGRA_1380 [Nosema granulosis]
MSALEISTVDNNSLMIMNFGFKGENFKKLAMFDFDNTLATFNGTDRMAVWRILFDNVKETLQNLYEKGYKIVILSNQSQILLNQMVHKDFVNKIKEFHKSVGLPMLVLVPQKKNKYRKPSIWAYKYLKDKYFSDSNLEDSFYVGDAAGHRENAPYPINCDLYFAKNAGLKFYLPEEYFKNKDPNYVYDPIDIRSYKSEPFEQSTRRIIFLYGLKKYNGKSFFINKYYHDYEVFDTPVACSKHCVYVNCNNLEFLKKIINEHPTEYKIYLLDYPPKILAWLKEFYFVNGQFVDKPWSPVKPQIVSYIKDKCEKVPFIFDDSFYNEEELEISKFILE